MHAKEYFASHDDFEELPFVSRNMEQHAQTASSDTSPEVPRQDVNVNCNGDTHPNGTLPSSVQFTSLGSPAQTLAEQPGAGTLEVGAVVEKLENPHQIEASWGDFKNYFVTEGNWTDLVATSFNWMLLDFTFYLLGVNSSSFTPTMFGQKVGSEIAPYELLVSNTRHIMESTSIGALLGGAVAMVVMNIFSRRKIQLWGFLILGALFVVVGSMYLTLPSTNAHLGVVICYGFCQLFFNFGRSSA